MRSWRGASGARWVAYLQYLKYVYYLQYLQYLYYLQYLRNQVAKLSDKWSALLTQLDTQQRRLDDTLPVRVHHCFEGENPTTVDF